MIPYGRQHIDERDVTAVVEVLRGGHLTQGPMIDAFEEKIRTYVGAKYAVAMSSGTAALHLAAIAAGVGPGNSLVTSPNCSLSRSGWRFRRLRHLKPMLS